MKKILSITLNGSARDDVVPGNMLLVDYLREHLGLTGTKMGCDGGECGACTVLVDGKATLSCITLAQSVNGKVIETIEGLADNDRMSALQRAFHEKLGAQCGYCMPGMVLTAKAMLDKCPHPTRDQIQAEMAGVLCRCTGYTKIVDAIETAVQRA